MDHISSRVFKNVRINVEDVLYMTQLKVWTS